MKMIISIIVILWSIFLSADFDVYTNKMFDFSINVPSSWIESDDNSEYIYSMSDDKGINSFDIIIEDVFTDSIYESRVELNLSDFDEDIRNLFLESTVISLESQIPSMSIIDSGFVNIGDFPLMFIEYNYDNDDERFICSQFMGIDNGYLYVLIFLAEGDDFSDDIKDIYTDMILSFELF